MGGFIELHDFKNFNLKNFNNTIGLLLINTPGCFQDKRDFETGISDFHKLVVTVLRAILRRKNTKL